ncbi:MAG: carbohydrate kinase [Gammaproteobacteria bacterium]
MQDKRPVIFGEVLFDCFPDGRRVLGGAPFNVAWHCQAFGLKPLFISRVGVDAAGQEIQAAMQDWHMDLTGLQQDRDHPTGMVTVSFAAGEPAYHIVENSAWDFIDVTELPDLDTQGVLYHGSLATRHPLSANTLEQIHRQWRGSIFIDVNLRTPWWSIRQIESLIRGRQWLKLNRDELALLVPQKQGVEMQARYLLAHYEISLVIITLGAAGAMAIDTHDSWHVKPQTSATVVDTVGAGDAFSSVLLLGQLRGWSLQDTLERAQQFAGAVVQQQGATSRDAGFYHDFIRDWAL